MQWLKEHKFISSQTQHSVAGFSVLLRLSLRLRLPSPKAKIKAAFGGVVLTQALQSFYKLNGCWQNSFPPHFNPATRHQILTFQVSLTSLLYQLQKAAHFLRAHTIRTGPPGNHPTLRSTLLYNITQPQERYRIFTGRNQGHVKFGGGEPFLEL